MVVGNYHKRFRAAYINKKTIDASRVIKRFLERKTAEVPKNASGLGQTSDRLSWQLLARSNRSGQAAVVNAIGRVPQRLAELDALTQHFDFLRAASGRIRRLEMVVFVGHKIFIMAIT